MKSELVYTKHWSGATIATVYPSSHQDGLNDTQLAFLRRRHLETLLRGPKAYSRNLHLKKTYKITLEDYNQLFTLQDKKCAICGKFQEESKRSFGVDHDHKTGKIRGILCSGCNTALSYFEKYKEEMQNYLDNPTAGF